MKKIENLCLPDKGKWRKLILTMKLTIVILLLGLMHVSASVYSQATKFSFNIKSRQIIDVLKEIEESSDYRFFFQDEQVDVYRTVSINVENETINKILTDLFADQKINYKVVNDKMILLTSTESTTENPSVQQNAKITGRVTDTMNLPLPGVTIVVKDTKNGTITDQDGNYILPNVPEDATLIFSFVGMKTLEINLNGRTVIDVRLEGALVGVDEVVVIGYGTQKIKNVTGSIASVDMQRVESIPATNMIDALAGQIPGMAVTSAGNRPGSNDARLEIRQTFDFSKDGGTTNPLIIIDDVIQIDPSTGLPSMTQFSRLDPSEIESIHVLRDASAAIYGSRASQGAIIVKTKRGKIGSTKVTYSGKFEWNDAVSHEKVMSAYETGVFANRILRLGGKTAANMYSDEELEQLKSLNYNWLDKAWKGAGSMQHSISVNGGTEKATYFAGISYYTQGANMGNQDYQRYNFRAGSDINITESLKLNATISAINDSQEKSYTKLGRIGDSSYGSVGAGEQADYTYLLHMPKHIPWSYNINGVDYWVSPALGPHSLSSTQNTANAIGAWNYFGLLENGSKSLNNNFSYSANFSLQYNIPFVKGLSVKGTYALTRSSDNAEQCQLPYILARATNTNTSDNHLYGEKSVWDIRENNKNARVVYDKSIGKSEQVNFYINYDHSFGKHNISAVASMERAEGFYEFSRLYYESPIIGTYNGSSSSAGTLSSSFTFFNKSENGKMSYLGRVNYDFDGKYMAQFIIRSDASTNFAPENYWGIFPSLSLGWTVSEESWFKDNLKGINYLKLRGSVGKTGKDNVQPWKWLQLYSYYPDKGLGFGSNGGTFIGGVTPEVTPYRDITWDTSMQYNFGIDLNTLNNRLSFNTDGYFNRTTNMLTNMAGASGVPISVGGAFTEQNYSAIDAWGLELSVSWKDKIGEVSYSIGMNTSLGWNKLKKYIDVGNDYESKISNKEGYSTIRPKYAYKVWKGNEMGDGILRTDADVQAYWDYLTQNAIAAGTTPKYFNITSVTNMKPGMLAYQDLGGTLQEDGSTGAPNGQISESGEDLGKMNKRDYNYGIASHFRVSWRNFSWNAQLSTTWGEYAMIDVIGQSQSSGRIIWSRETFWTDMFDPTDNPTGKYPNIYYSEDSKTTSASDYWEVSSFRCYVRNMNFDYTLPKSLVKKIGVENVKLSLSGNNLWDFFNPYPKHYRNMYDSTNTKYPTLRTWVLGVNLTF